jgi:hypothetical protein
LLSCGMARPLKSKHLVGLGAWPVARVEQILETQVQEHMAKGESRGQARHREGRLTSISGRTGHRDSEGKGGLQKGPWTDKVVSMSQRAWVLSCATILTSRGRRLHLVTLCSL